MSAPVVKPLSLGARTRGGKTSLASDAPFLERVAAGDLWEAGGEPLLRVYEDEWAVALLDTWTGRGWTDGTTIILCKMDAPTLESIGEVGAGRMMTAVTRVGTALKRALSTLSGEAPDLDEWLWVGVPRPEKLRRVTQAGEVQTGRRVTAMPMSTASGHFPVGLTTICCEGRAAGAQFSRLTYQLTPRRAGDNCFRSPEIAMMYGGDEARDKSFHAMGGLFDPGDPAPRPFRSFPSAVVQTAVIRALRRPDWPSALPRVRIFAASEEGAMIALDTALGPHADKSTPGDGGPRLRGVISGSSSKAADLSVNQDWGLSVAGHGLVSLVNQRTGLSLAAEGRAVLAPGVRIVQQRAGRCDPLRFQIVPVAGRPGYVHFRVPVCLIGEIGGGSIAFQTLPSPRDEEIDENDPIARTRRDRRRRRKRLPTIAEQLAKLHRLLPVHPTPASPEEQEVARQVLRGRDDLSPESAALQHWLYLSLDRVETARSIACGANVGLELVELNPSNIHRTAFRLTPFYPLIGPETVGSVANAVSAPIPAETETPIHRPISPLASARPPSTDSTLPRLHSSPRRVPTRKGPVITVFDRSSAPAPKPTKKAHPVEHLMRIYGRARQEVHTPKETHRQARIRTLRNLPAWGAVLRGEN